MTHNQISWWTLQETIRHNKESEVIGHRQADAAQSSAGAAWANAREMVRHNQAYEAELNRHNQQSERVDYMQQAAQQNYWEGLVRNQKYSNETQRQKVQNDYMIGQEQQSTNRIDMVWRNANQSGKIGYDIITDIYDRITGTLKKNKANDSLGYTFIYGGY